MPTGSEFVRLDPAALGSGATYDVMVACIQPRPIAFVSTLDRDGRPNLAPFSFFMPGGSNPPSLAFSVTRGSGGSKKDTLKNIEATGEFVVNIVSPEMAEGMNETSVALPLGQSEWPLSGFDPIASIIVSPPRVRVSPAQFEYRTHSVVYHGEQSGSAAYVIGEIVAMHLREDLWSDQGLLPVPVIARLGGPNYLDVQAGRVFSMNRP